MHLFFNRRHLLKSGGDVSFIVTSQKYKTCPRVLRDIITSIIFFRVQDQELKAIVEECVYGTMKKDKVLGQIIADHLIANDHNFVYIMIQPKYKIILNFDTDLTT